MVQDTYRNIYDTFLAGVRKNKVGTIFPEEFAILWNDSTEEVVTNKLSIFEVNKKIITDLLPLKRVFNSIVSNAIEKSNYKYFSCTFPNDLRREIDIDVIVDDKQTRHYLLKGNQKFNLFNDPYYKPSKLRVYYDYINGNNINGLNIYTPIDANSVKVLIEYYKHPYKVTSSDVILDKLCEFEREMSNEIIDTAIRKSIERNQDPRYQTIINEAKLSNNNQ